VFVATTEKHSSNIKGLHQLNLFGWCHFDLAGMYRPEHCIHWLSGAHPVSYANRYWRLFPRR